MIVVLTERLFIITLNSYTIIKIIKILI